MKKLFAVVTLLVMVLTLASCGRKEKTDETLSGGNTENAGDIFQEEELVETGRFYNDTVDGRWSAEAISVVPKEVFWENGALVARCYVVNGFSKAAYNVHVEKVEIFNGKGEAVAGGTFGAQNLSIAPLAYVEHTFTFTDDAVLTLHADLSTLTVNASTRANH